MKYGDVSEKGHGQLVQADGWQEKTRPWAAHWEAVLIVDDRSSPSDRKHEDGVDAQPVGCSPVS